MVHGARAQDINFYSHIMIVYPRCCSARGLHLPVTAPSHKLLSVMPLFVSSRNFFPYLAQRSRSSHATEASLLLDAIEHDDVGAGCNGFVDLVFVPYFDI